MIQKTFTQPDTSAAPTDRNSPAGLTATTSPSQTQPPNDPTELAQPQAPIAPTELAPPPPPAEIPVLQKLSNAPFPRGKFPFLGILASVYEHVTAVGQQVRDSRAAR